MKEIASALVKAQKAFGPALKTSANPHFRTKYASLDACIEAVLDGLNDNGIMLTQKTFEHMDGVVVETVFIHESGESMEMGRLFVPASKGDAQGFGSALTYARRYSLMAACGIAPEDDDGNAASRPKPKPEPRPEPKPVEKPAQKPVPAVAEGREGSWQLRVTAEPDGVTWDEWADLVIETAKIGLSQCETKAHVMEIFKVNRNIFDRMKAEASGKYEEMMAAFKEAKEKFKE
jgi:hypothetical protein